MRKLHVIGIGAGDPDHLTLQAIKALNEVDVFFIPDKGEEKEELRRLRLDICARHATARAYRTAGFAVPRRDRQAGYEAGVDAWHAAIAARYETLLRDEMAESECGALLVWGDPALYDSTLRILDRVRSNGLAFDYDVIPGISSIQALAARHRVPLNRIGEPVAVVPGRRLEEVLAQGLDSVVVVLDGDRAYRRLAGEAFDIFWGASVGAPDEALVSGRLSDVADEIDRAREQGRAAKGWIMDSYLIRRRRPES